MCGISGFIIKGNQKVLSSNIIDMTRAIKHRGPDDEGYFCVNDGWQKHYSGTESTSEIKSKFPLISDKEYVNRAMGFRRLAIIDLSDDGHQPMAAEGVTLTFNGEIYNYRELRSELIQKGHEFHSASDSEVVLHAYLEWGINFVKRLNGMFAICLYDSVKEITYLVRDRIGIKPLFYHDCGKAITWCSEIKGILKAEWVNAEIDFEGLIANYQFITTPTPVTCFQNIRSLPPGSVMEIKNDGLSIKKYWDYPIGFTNDRIDQTKAAELITEKLRAVLQRQLHADVPVITMMSGGIDSTFLTALATETDPGLSCYSLSIDGTGYDVDEFPQAKIMADKLGVHQLVHEINDDDIIKTSVADIKHFEEPYNNPDVIFTASEFLRNRGYKAVISGNGADEVFGGYGYTLKMKDWRRRQSFSALSAIVPQISITLQKIKYHLEMDSVGDFFMSSTGGMRTYSIDGLFKQYNRKQIREILKPFLNFSGFRTDYEGLFYFDLKYSVGSHHVYHDDLCAMKYGVEMRYPYLDHELIEVVSSIPLNIRFNGRQTKPLLRGASKAFISEQNLTMKKKGFGLPINKKIIENKVLGDFVQTRIQHLKQTGIFDNAAINQIIRDGYKRRSFQYVWQLVSTSVWLEEYFNL